VSIVTRATLGDRILQGNVKAETLCAVREVQLRVCVGHFKCKKLNFIYKPSNRTAQ